MTTVLFALLLFAAVPTAWPAPSDPRPLAGRIVVLDPGHAVLNEQGWIINPGARARRGAYERDIALKVAEKTVPLLEAHGAKVFLTRTPDNPWRYGRRKSGDNRARAIFANVLNADANIRIHCDWNRSRKFNGHTTYYFRWGSRELAKSLRKAFAETLPKARDNGIKRKSFVSVTAQMPTVLMELGVLSYRSEAKLLATESYQSRCAQALASGVIDYFSKLDAGGAVKVSAVKRTRRTRVRLP